MMTAEEGDKLLDAANASFTSALKEFAEIAAANPDGNFAFEFGYLLEEHDSLLSTMSKIILQVHQKVDFYKDRNARVEMVSSILNLLNTSINFLEMYGDIASEKNGIRQVKVAPNSYDTIQLFLNSFHWWWQLRSIRKRLRFQNVNILPHFNKLKKPMTKESRFMISVVTGAISVAVVLLILLFKQQIPLQLHSYLRILFALGCGGLSASVIGTITVKRESNLKVSATGGFAVFVLILYLQNEGGSRPLTILLRDSISYEIIHSEDVSLTLLFDGKPLPGVINPPGYLFDPIPLEFINTEKELLLKSDTYLFTNSKKQTKIILPDERSIDVKVIKNETVRAFEAADTTMLFRSGLVRIGNSEPINDAHVSVKGSYEETKSVDGQISLSISKKLHPNKEFVLIIKKDGYDVYERKHSYPPPSDLTIGLTPLLTTN